MKIGIRVDANPIIATGHIVRTTAVAGCIKKMGHDVLFICADDGCVPFLQGKDLEYVILNKKWDDYNSEIDIMIGIIEKYGIESLLVDSYYITPEYMQEISKHVKVTYFDELYLKGYGCQQVINGFIEPPDYSGDYPKAFVGPGYAPLREEFWDLPPKKINERLETLLVTSGGTDNYHFCKLFMESFLAKEEFSNIKVILVLGRLSVDKDELVEKYSDNPRVELYVATNKMCELMQRADYAVTAGGTTLYEIAAVGVCASSFAMADNQVDITRLFNERGLVSFAGDLRYQMDLALENILNQIKAAMPSGIRAGQAVKLQAVVDGQGSRRIAEILL